MRGKRFWPGENKVGGECFVLECNGGWNADELENDFLMLLCVIVSIEVEDVAEDAATAIRFNSISIYKGKIWRIKIDGILNSINSKFLPAAAAAAAAAAADVPNIGLNAPLAAACTAAEENGSLGSIAAKWWRPNGGWKAAASCNPPGKADSIPLPATPGGLVAPPVAAAASPKLAAKGDPGRSFISELYNYTNIATNKQQICLEIYFKNKRLFDMMNL